MSLIVQPIPVAARLVDTIARLTPTQLREMHDAGVDGVIAYLGRNLDTELLANAGALGMGVVPVNESRAPGWIPTADMGASDAAASAARMAALGVPMDGLDDWCDVEGCGGDPSAYCAEWCATLTHDGSGRVPKAYVGAGSLLTAERWYLMRFRGYWHSCSASIPEPKCGFQMVQLFPPNQPLAGTTVDYDVACRDYLSRAPTWARAA